MVTTTDIRSIAPEARGCFFEDEQDLTFYEKYTFINCRLECAILRVETLIGCIPWHLPKVIDIYLNISLQKNPLLLVEKRLKNL